MDGSETSLTDLNYDENKLDGDYRRMLRIIKQFIPCAMNHDHVYAYQTWLEKLSDVDSGEKEVRNRYVAELCRQIQNRVLEKPFTQPPPKGDLLPVQPLFRNIVNNVQHCDKAPVQNYTCMASNQPIDKYDDYSEHYSETKMGLPDTAVMRKVNAHATPKKRFPHTFLKDAPERDSNLTYNNYLVQQQQSNFPYLEMQKNSLQNSGHSYQMLQQQFVKSKQPASYNLKNNTKRSLSESKRRMLNLNRPMNNIETEDESSWYDMSDCSCSSTITKIDVEKAEISVPEFNSTNSPYEKRIFQMANVIQELQRQNIYLNQNIAKYEQDLKSSNTISQRNIDNLEAEVATLKSKLKDLTEAKTVLKDSQITTSSQCQSIVDSVNKKLLESQSQNTELKADMNAVQKKLEQFSSQRQNEFVCLKQKLADMHLKEIEILKQNHIKHMAELEQKFTHILAEKDKEFNRKLNEIKQFYESKIEAITDKYEKTIQSRNMEIQRLDALIEDQCKRMHAEVNGMQKQMEDNANTCNDFDQDKVALLEKCIIKMDKLLRKTQNDHDKQIEKLTRELGLRDRTLQFQLTKQRAELITHSATAKQQEIDSMVNKLEEQYRILVDKQQARFVQEKQNDNKLISELRSVLAKNNCHDVYNICKDM